MARGAKRCAVSLFLEEFVSCALVSQLHGTSGHIFNAAYPLSLVVLMIVDFFEELR